MGILILTILRIIIGNQEIYKKCNELKLLFNSTIVVKENKAYSNFRVSSGQLLILHIILASLLKKVKINC